MILLRAARHTFYIHQSAVKQLQYVVFIPVSSAKALLSIKKGGPEKKKKHDLRHLGHYKLHAPGSLFPVQYVLAWTVQE